MDQFYHCLNNCLYPGPNYQISNSPCSSSSDYTKLSLENKNDNSEYQENGHEHTDVGIDSALLTAFEQNYSISKSPFDEWQTDSSSSTVNTTSQGFRRRKSKHPLMNLLSLPHQSMIRQSPITKYHSNMVRQYPGAEYRTPEEQEKRRKNTEAVRQSRHTAKQIRDQIEQNEIYMSKKNDELRMEIAAKIVRVQELFNSLDLPPFDFETEWDFYLKSTNPDEMTSEESDKVST